FFSSRRRHTRFSRDWSSDVCSSDLFTYVGPNVGTFPVLDPETGAAQSLATTFTGGRVYDAVSDGSGGMYVGGDFDLPGEQVRLELGRASCRERGERAVVADSCSR